MRLASFARLVSIVALSPLAACAVEAEDTSRHAGCDLDPELTARPAALTGNGVQINGIQVNGIQSNGVQMNGVQMNGVQMNGVQMNGVSDGRIALNGDALGQPGLAKNEIVGFAGSGALVSGEAMVGAKLEAVLSDGKTIALEITAFERSTARPDVALYALAYEGRNICGDDTMGTFLPGVWDATGAHQAHASLATFSCTTGAIAKCALGGYAPWRVGADVHQACTRMIRADYCGTGVSFTKNGTAIDTFDAQGFELPAAEPGFLFEAGWGPNGATCVSRPRFDGKTASGTAVRPSCWARLPVCGSFEDAKAAGAIMGNASRPQSSVVCR